LQDSIKADLKEKGYENGKWMELSWDHVPKWILVFLMLNLCVYWIVVLTESDLPDSQELLHWYYCMSHFKYIFIFFSQKIQLCLLINNGVSVVIWVKCEVQFVPFSSKIYIKCQELSAHCIVWVNIPTVNSDCSP
jgi:hypothetical protein